MLGRRDAINQMHEGIRFYHSKQKRVEYLTISKSHEDLRDIENLFQSLLYQIRIHSVNQFFPLDWFGVKVENNHMHVLIRKPFIRSEIIVNLWKGVLGYGGNLRCYTVKKERQRINDLVMYIAEQDEKHSTQDTIFFKSEYWGKIHKKGESFKKVTRFEQIKRDLKRLNED